MKAITFTAIWVLYAYTAYKMLFYHGGISLGCNRKVQHDTIPVLPSNESHSHSVGMAKIIDMHMLPPCTSGNLWLDIAKVISDSKRDILITVAFFIVVTMVDKLIRELISYFETDEDTTEDSENEEMVLRIDQSKVQGLEKYHDYIKTEPKAHHVVIQPASKSNKESTIRRIQPQKRDVIIRSSIRPFVKSGNVVTEKFGSLRLVSKNETSSNKNENEKPVKVTPITNYVKVEAQPRIQTVKIEDVEMIDDSPSKAIKRKREEFHESGRPKKKLKD